MAKHGQIELDGVKQGQTTSNMVKWGITGQTGPIGTTYYPVEPPPSNFMVLSIVIHISISRHPFPDLK